MHKSKFRNKKQTIKTARGRSSSSIKWLKRNLNDPYINMAKQYNYRSRSAFKLIQIHEKFNIFNRAHRILDLGCAPGGWLQVAKMLSKDNTKLVGVDIKELDPIAGVITIMGDIYEESTIAKMIEALDGKPDLILSDMAAPASGFHEADHLRNISLTEAAFEFAKEQLVEGGTFIAKILKGGQESEFIKQMKRHFTQVKSFKPDASYNDSSEFYLICIGYHATKSFST